MKNKFLNAITLAVVLAMLVTSLALADEVYADGDNVSPVAQNPLNFGNVCVGDTVSGPVLLAIRRQANTNSDTVFANSATVTISVASTSGAGLSAAMGVDNTVTLPSNWQDLSTTTMSINTANSTVSLNATGLPLGAYVGTVEYNGTGNNSAPPPTTITRSGNLTVNANIVNCDTTAPVISYTVNGVYPASPDGNNGWFVSDVFVDWTVTDPESSFTTTGCVDTTINSDTAVAGTTLSCSATSAGGPAGPVTVTIKRDATAPINVSGAPNRPADNGTWYNHAVDVAFTGSDAPSGIASCTTTSYSGPDGSGVTVNGSCTDNAGNTSAPVASSAFNYDGTAPTNVVLSVTAGTAGTNGWYTSDVTVHTSSDADVSGVTCSVDQFQTTETTGAVFNGSCTNGAGLTSNAAPLTVKLDKTGPSAALAVTAGTLGDNGWYTSNVTVSTSGTDSISSPVTCTADQFQTTDTASATFNGSCTNDAGLSTNAASLTIKRDATAPSVTVTPDRAPDHSGWYNAAVVFDTNGTDGMSGLDSCDADQTYTGPDGSNLTVSGSCMDNAGNVGNGTSAAFDFDDTNPSVTVTPDRAPDHNGWYNAAVVFDTAGTDATSGIDTCSADQTYTGPDDLALFVSGFCTDNAGNIGNGTSAAFDFDDTNPTIDPAWIGGFAYDGVYYFGFVPAYPPNPCVAYDNLSGVPAGVAGCEVTGYSTAIGMHTLTATATDNAGNEKVETLDYEVKAWTITGFYAPVDKGIHNNVKGGATVPLKFEIFAGPTELTNTSIVSAFTQKISCASGVGDDIEQYATGGTSLRYDTTSGQFIFNWQTPKQPGACYRVTMTTTDGSFIYADFKLK